MQRMGNMKFILSFAISVVLCQITAGVVIPTKQGLVSGFESNGVSTFLGMRK
jgi:hypothetical protein